MQGPPRLLKTSSRPRNLTTCLLIGIAARRGRAAALALRPALVLLVAAAMAPRIQTAQASSRSGVRRAVVRAVVRAAAVLLVLLMLLVSGGRR